LALPALAANYDVGTDAQRAAGKQLYDKFCSQCHGDTGAGDGPAAIHLLPAPRNFTTGKFKIRTTPNGALPTHEDLKNIIRRGMPYTSMPAWPDFTDEELSNLAYYLTTFSEEFAKPDSAPQVAQLASAPAADDKAAERGRKVYEEAGCLGCHGELGRGDGASAPTLKDDWGYPLRSADLTARWTFRGGSSAEDIFRTFSTGLNGTPMPSYFDALSNEQRWDLTRYIESLGPAAPGYSNLLHVKHVDGPIDLAQADELFAAAPAARFPIVGQITEPGRSFHPPAHSVLVQAVYDTETIAFRVRWHDMSAQKTGSNSPALAVPLEEEQQPAPASAPAAGAAGADDPWGEEAAAEPAPAAAASDDIWGETETPGAAAQLPATLPSGARKPYFLFGDGQEAVDLWFFDLARSQPRQYVGRGSSALTPSEAGEVLGAAVYDKGEWTATFVRPLRSTTGVSFQASQFVPLLISLWDGHTRERGNRRGLTVWYHLYLEPETAASPVGAMIKTALVVFLVEIALIAWVRKKAGKGRVVVGRRAASAPEPT
jgi:mono/diheme cytochrome c family protein